MQEPIKKKCIEFDLSVELTPDYIGDIIQKKVFIDYSKTKINLESRTVNDKDKWSQDFWIRRFNETGEVFASAPDIYHFFRQLLFRELNGGINEIENAIRIKNEILKEDIVTSTILEKREHDILITHNHKSELVVPKTHPIKYWLIDNHDLNQSLEYKEITDILRGIFMTDDSKNDIRKILNYMRHDYIRENSMNISFVGKNIGDLSKAMPVVMSFGSFTGKATKTKIYLNKEVTFQGYALAVKYGR